MGFSKVVAAVASAGEVLLHPARALGPLATRRSCPGGFAASQLLPLTALASIAAVIGMAVVGYPMPDGWVRFDLFWDALLRGLLLWLFLTGGILLAGLASAMAAPRFGGRSDSAAGVAAVGYASIPLLAAYLLALFPPATPLIPIGGLYGAYILSLAARPFLGVPKERALVFALAVAAAAIAIGAGGWLLFRVIVTGGEGIL
jgi:hypothetical protein